MVELRQYQREAVDSIYAYYQSGHTGHPVIAMPTGTGKSLVIAEFIRGALQTWPGQRFIMATHVKELIEQNAAKMLAAWLDAPLGVFSAGLKRREYSQPIIFGSIQSMRSRAALFGHRDLLVIDECHLLSPKEDTNYITFIHGLLAINPKLKVIGLSATPYRLGQGLITDSGLFTDICFDITSLALFNRLIEEGWLCPLIPKRTRIELEVGNVKIQAGDYNQKELQVAVDQEAITNAACKEMCELGATRRSWVVFASGIEHSNHIAAILKTMGISARSVHSKITDEERQQALNAFKSGELRCVVNNNVLTTGFDHPGLDMIGVLRPTASTGLWVQMLGRGTRPAEGKGNCLVLDFAGNTKRLGCINDPVIPKRRGERTRRAPVRLCKACGCYNHARAKVCTYCGAPFEATPMAIKHDETADTRELIKKNEAPWSRATEVQDANYSWQKEAGEEKAQKALVEKLRGARQRMRAKTGRCEGRKPFGHHPGEQQTIKAMIDYASDKRVSVAAVADLLNVNGYKSRSGKPWNRNVVARILKANEGEAPLSAPGLGALSVDSHRRSASASRSAGAEEGTLRQQMVACGKRGCKKCADGPGHGPYWYLYRHVNGKLISKYIGKTLDGIGGNGVPSNTGDSHQIDLVVYVIREYLSRPFVELKGYGVDAKMQHDRVVPWGYVQRRLSANGAFQRDKLGANASLRRAVEGVIAEGSMREATASDTWDRYGKSMKCYCIIDAARFLGEPRPHNGTHAIPIIDFGI